MKPRINLLQISACVLLLLLYNLCCCSVIKDISEEHNHTESSIFFGDFQMNQNFSNSGMYHDWSNHEHEHEREHEHQHFHDDNFHRDHLKPIPIKNMETTTLPTTIKIKRTKNPTLNTLSKSTDPVDNYPFEKIRKLISSNNLLKDYFNQPAVLTTRFNTGEENNDELELCRTESINILYPKRLKNLRDEDVVLVNDEQNYTQPIQHHNCVSTGPCTIPFDTLGFRSYCSQEYYTAQLMVYKNDKITFDQFRVPSCCTCKIKKV